MYNTHSSRSTNPSDRYYHGGDNLESDIMEVPAEYYLSVCCSSVVDVECPIHTKLQRKRCASCGLFCSIDEEQTLNAYNRRFED